MSKLVSIIIPSYNSLSTIGATIASVQNQSYPHWELIIVDDSSTDETLDFIFSLAHTDSRITVITNYANSGQAICRNLGLKFANGDFLCFLDSDDIFISNKIILQLNFLLNNPNIDLVGSQAYTIDSNSDSFMSIENRPLHHNYLRANINLRCPLLLSSVMCRSKCFDYLCFPNITPVEDYTLWFLMIDRGFAFANLDVPLIIYRKRKCLPLSHFTSSLSRNFILYSPPLAAALSFRLLIIYLFNLFSKRK